VVIELRVSESDGEHLLDRTASLCASCGACAEALIIERGGRVYQRCGCADHAQNETLLFSDARFFRQLEEWNRLVFNGRRIDAGDEADDETKPPLLAVIDLTNRCNYHCPVCFADSLPAKDTYFLDVPTVRRMLQALLDHGSPPCRQIQFSGGEPTLHPQFLDIVRMARDMGFTHIQAATNGSRFEDHAFVQQAEAAGLQTLYLQFDGMDDRVYLTLRGRPLVEAKVRAVENVAATSMRIVLVPTIVPGVNVDQIAPIFRFAVGHSRHITGISVQPMADAGRVGVDRVAPASAFNLADMAIEFGRQTGLTKFPDDWFPLNAVAMLTRGIARLRSERTQHPACDAYCSVGTYFYVNDRDEPTCVNRFFDMSRFLQAAAALENGSRAHVLRRPVSELKRLYLLSACFDRRAAPPELTFRRMLRGLDGWEDKSVGRGTGWHRRGYNGMFVAGMHFMDAGNYSLRRLRRCIIKYVTTAGDLVSFCRYNAGERYRDREEVARLNASYAVAR
jgi:uncharacterized radical SAM superfamily Fe-S cluster-containing enzyme